MNQVGLVGRITKDPVLREFSEGRVHTSFFIAVNRNYRNQQGSVNADFVLCVAWGKLAERIAQYCGKGSLVGINGRLQTRTYVNKEKVKVYSTEVVVDDVRFYLLKQPGVVEADKNNQHTFSKNQVNQFVETEKQNHEVPNDFELPKKEEVLPIT